MGRGGGGGSQRILNQPAGALHLISEKWRTLRCHVPGGIVPRPSRKKQRNEGRGRKAFFLSEPGSPWERGGMFRNEREGPVESPLQAAGQVGRWQLAHSQGLSCPWSDTQRARQRRGNQGPRSHHKGGILHCCSLGFPRCGGHDRFAGRETKAQRGNSTFQGSLGTSAELKPRVQFSHRAWLPPGTGQGGQASCWVCRQVCNLGTSHPSRLASTAASPTLPGGHAAQGCPSPGEAEEMWQSPASCSTQWSSLRGA